jgi:hypothetical protein
MSTPPFTSGAPEARLSSSPSSSPHSRARPLSRANEYQISSALHSSPGNSTIPQESILLSPANTKFDTSPTPSVILTLHHHDDRKASSAPASPIERMSPPVSLMPASLNERSYSPRHLPHQHDNLRGDTTPPNGVPRKWWSRPPSSERGRSVSPSRGRGIPFRKSRFRDPVVSAIVSDSNPLISDDFAEQETPLPSSLPDDLSLARLSNDLPSTFRRDLDERNINDEDRENENSLLLSSPEATPATRVSFTPPTATHIYPQTLRSLGVGIEEDERRHDIDNSYWSKLPWVSPKSPPKSLSADVGTSASESDTNSKVEAGSMETWNGRSLDVPPLVISSSPTKGKAPALLNHALSSALPGMFSYFFCETCALSPARKTALYFSWERKR